MYSKYGLVFKTIRNQKNCTLHSFTKIGASSASICKFEKGQSMLRFDTLTTALNQLSFTLAEYELFLNNYDLDEHEYFLQLLKDTVYKRASISDLKEFAMSINEPILVIILNSIDSNITVKNKETILDYFENLVFWRELDLYSLYLCLNHFKPSIISYLLETFFTTNQEILKSEPHRVALALVISRAILIFISKNHKELSHHFLNYIAPNTYDHTMFTKNLYYYTHGCWDHKFNHSELGIKQIQKSLNIFEDLASKEISNYYKQLCEMYLNVQF